MTRDLIKCVKVLFIALLTIFLVFPLIHETGHAFFTILAGGEIKNINIFPVPCVLCSVTDLSDWEIAFIGGGGMILAFIFSAILKFRRNFYLWFFCFFFRFMSFLSLGISFVSALLWGFGIYTEKEDAVIMLDFWREGYIFILLSIGVLLLFTVLMLKRDHLIQRVSDFFELGESPSKNINFAKEQEGHI